MNHLHFVHMLSLIYGGAVEILSLLNEFKWVACFIGFQTQKNIKGPSNVRWIRLSIWMLRYTLNSIIKYKYRKPIKTMPKVKCDVIFIKCDNVNGELTVN